MLDGSEEHPVEVVHSGAWNIENLLATILAKSWEELEKHLIDWVPSHATEFNLSHGAMLIARIADAPPLEGRPNHTHERWYLLCRKVVGHREAWRLLQMTEDDVRTHQAAVAMASANFYDPDADASVGENSTDLHRRLEALRRAPG